MGQFRTIGIDTEQIASGLFIYSIIRDGPCRQNSLHIWSDNQRKGNEQGFGDYIMGE